MVNKSLNYALVGCTANVEQEDIEDCLADILNTEFDLVLEDDSLQQVSGLLSIALKTSLVDWPTRYYAILQIKWI